MNKYCVAYKAEILEDLSDYLLCAGDVVNASLFDYDEAEHICAESFF